MNLTVPKTLSIVIPLYNEQERFKEGFEVCKTYAKQYPKWEFIFVNDGSTDKTAQTVEKMTAGRKQMRLVSYQRNQGKGYAIRKGIQKARMPLVLFTDIDFSTPISELELLYPFIKNGADVVIGTRKVKGARISKRQAKLREWLGKQFTNVTNFWLGLDISDFTCGFKLFKTPVAKKLFTKQQVRRWGFDAEILYVAHRAKHQIVEVPVQWHNDERTKVSLVKDIVRSLSDLITIRWSSLLGKYSQNKKCTSTIVIEPAEDASVVQNTLS